LASLALRVLLSSLTWGHEESRTETGRERGMRRRRRRRRRWR
jgi:hypothetical protein